jgi:tRNA-2-methylthio-N6-dimethylallyladenosine synthase
MFNSMSGRAHIENGPKSTKKVYLETFGCQMNELDSELVRGHLGALGYSFTSDHSAADVILYNTCSVREQAENKVWSRIGLMGLRKKEGAAFVLGVIGCMAERDGGGMMRRFPQVDLMCGPGELDKLPMLIDNALKTDAVERADRIALQGSNSRRSSTLSAANDNLEMLDLSRAFDPDRASAGNKTAYVRITRGCNKFCTYCVVPYTRGAEVHRPPDAIIDECKMLADRGVIEITLLGQTVNHYTYTHGAAIGTNGTELPQIGPGFKNGRAKQHAAHSTQGSARTTSFADLLKRIHDEVPAIQRLRFVTSFPRDFGDDILHVMAESPRICKYLHVPAQSGSNRILKLMNRGYTAEQYIEFIDRARDILPAACIAGDFIVGFPTETEEDFELTMQLLQRVRYKNSFIFKYSPRPGTVAIDRFSDDVPEEVKRRRNNQLLSLQSQISAEVHAQYIGRTVDVFVEQISRAAHARASNARKPAAVSNGIDRVELRWEKPSQKSEGRGQKSEGKNQNSGVFSTIQLSGRTEGDLIAAFEIPPGTNPDRLIGCILPVKVTDSASLILKGHLANAATVAEHSEAIPALSSH